MKTKEFQKLFDDISQAPRFGLNEARSVTRHDWRTWVLGLNTEIKAEIEEFFYFTEGFVESIDEGFVEKTKTAPDLHEKARQISSALDKLELSP